MVRPRIPPLGAGSVCVRRAAVVLLALATAGCGLAKRDDLVDEVLKSDPGFSAVLQKHRELTSRIETAKRELELKRTTIERNIAQLRKDLAASAASARVKTADIKKRMEPDQQRLTMGLSMASDELRAKRIQRASLGRSIAQLRKSLNRQDNPETPEERTRERTQLEEMLEDAARFDDELTALKQHVRFLKIKLLLIKL